MLFWQQLSAILTLTFAVLAYLARREWPFAEPISFLDHGAGGWGYHAVLAGCTAVLLTGLRRVWLEGRFFSCLVHAAALVPVGILVLNPNGCRWHDPMAMLLGAIGLLWMFERALTATVIWRRSAPWIGLLGLVFLASGRWGLGEAGLLVGMAVAAGAEPAEELVLLPAAPNRPMSALERILDVGVPGLGWGIFLLAVTFLGGSLRGFLLPPLVLILGWGTGWLLARWNPGFLASAAIRIAPVLLLLKAAGADAVGTTFLMILAAGGLVILGMARTMFDEG